MAYRRSAAVVVAAALTWAVVIAGLALGFQLANLHNGMIAVSFATVGAIVLYYRPGHREGRLLLAVGVAHGVMYFCRQYGLRDPPLAGAEWIGWLGVWPLPLVLVLVGAAVMCFPDGRFPARGWKIAFIGMLVLGLFLSLVSALWPVEYARTGLTAPHPLHVPGGQLAAAVFGVAQPAGYLLLQLVWAACIAVRLLRSRGTEALQMRGFVYAVVLGVIVLVSGLVLVGSPLPGILTVPLVAVAAGIGIVRHRLYDIDLVINKTMVIGLMALVITAGYVAVVVGIGSLLGAGQGLVLPLVATALVAIAFEPLRRRAQAVTDRLVYGRRASPYEALARLPERLSAHPADDGLLDGICTTIADAVGALEVVLRVGPDAASRPVAIWPPGRSATLAVPGLQVRPITHGGEVSGSVTVLKKAGEGLSAGEDRMLRDLAAQAGLLLELRAAAKRLLAAQDLARRRIERDLHDGAQQQLVTLGLGLGRLVVLAEATGNQNLAEAARDARATHLAALADLRELARGIHPSILTEGGLVAAMENLADRSPILATITVEHLLPCQPEVEATAYFVVSEGLTNAAKHSGATSVAVSLSSRGDALHLRIADDGRGGARGAAGGGLQGLADRVATLGGRLTVDSPVGVGTTLTAEIPCG